ncbi:MOSC domain protein [Ketogulonicigenium robustum]|uniref:MOSC domain protein n=1 Tax=Ketogulonicigenium robustum TaxID=92947 RepID=A0A1W6P299_9RHOB|nr:MOSC domain-containing protein [Ketogulonicigenium robustum]ARO15511.1 MOSC domain protein [Ketogulonicigenium robustum]
MAVAMQVVDLWRHPIKAHGREQVTLARLTAGEGFPFDRIWAVAHDLSKYDPDHPAWVSCANFQRAARTPEVMAITAQLDEGSGHITLQHPRIGSYHLVPEDAVSVARFLAWLAPISPQERFRPVTLARAGRAMTDTAEPTVSLNFTASLADLSRHMGQDLSRDRWRANIWVDGLAPWAEFELVGRRLRIGTAECYVTERIGRCAATMVNPLTGARDGDTLRALREVVGEQDFGVFVTVTQDGTVRPGDKIEVL